MPAKKTIIRSKKLKIPHSPADPRRVETVNEKITRDFYAEVREFNAGFKDDPNVTETDMESAAKKSSEIFARQQAILAGKPGEGMDPDFRVQQLPKDDISIRENIKEFMAATNGTSIVLDARIANAKTFFYSSTLSELLEYAEKAFEWSYKINSFLLSRSASQLTPAQYNILMLRMSMFEKLEIMARRQAAVLEMPSPAQTVDWTENVLVVALIEYFKMKEGKDEHIGVNRNNQQEIARQYGGVAKGSGQHLFQTFSPLLKAESWKADRQIGEKYFVHFHRAYDIFQAKQGDFPAGYQSILTELKTVRKIVRGKNYEWVSKYANLLASKE